MKMTFLKTEHSVCVHIVRISSEGVVVRCKDVVVIKSTDPDCHGDDGFG
jgi:hypothetical protein